MRVAKTGDENNNTFTVGSPENKKSLGLQVALAMNVSPGVGDECVTG